MELESEVLEEFWHVGASLVLYSFLRFFWSLTSYSSKEHVYIVLLVHNSFECFNL